LQKLVLSRKIMEGHGHENTCSGERDTVTVEIVLKPIPVGNKRLLVDIFAV
jgi:hypothetical protein